MSDAENVLEDAITLLRSRASLAFSEIREKGHRDLLKITAEADGYRRERDAKVTALHAAECEVQDLKVEVELLTGKCEKSEATLKHQRGLTNSARQESQQWRDQVMRLEEAHAQEQEAHVQEIQQWKDQYRRVEKERHQLAAQLEESFSRSRRQTPIYSQSKVSGPALSTRTKASAREYARDDDLSPTAVSEDEYQHPSKRRRRETPERSRVRGEGRKHRSSSRTHSRTRRSPLMPMELEHAANAHEMMATSSRRRTSGNFSKRESAAPQDKPLKKIKAVRPPELVRRVHAVISMPVKEEEDDAYALGVESGGLFDSGGTPPSTDRGINESGPSQAPRTKSGRIVKKAPSRVHSGRTDGPSYLELDEEDAQSDEADDDGDNMMDGDYDDEEGVRGRKRRNRSQPRRSRSTTAKKRTVTDEDDPLLLRHISEDTVKSTRQPKRTSRAASRSRR